MEIVYENLQITDFERIYFGGFPPPEIEEGGSGWIPESEGLGGPPNPRSAPNLKKISKKSFEIRPISPLRAVY